MKHLCDREIGHRAYQAILQNILTHGTSITEEARRIGINKKEPYRWGSGETAPSTFALQRMWYAGYDIVYILTGRKIK